MKIGSVNLPSPFAVAPMAGMTDTAFRRLVKRHGGCGLVVTEMVSAEGLVRGIDRTLEYAEYTEEERPISIQIFGGDPAKMAAAAQIVEGMGADIVDVNMGCPVPKIAKHNAGCSLMREPEHAASVIEAMAKAVRIPVTVKMRAGWNDDERNAPTLAKMVQDAGAAAIAVHGRRRRATAEAPTRTWWRALPTSSRSRCSAAATASSRHTSSIVCGRACRACWWAAACCAIRGFWRRRWTLPPGASRAK
jgi:tRNA-dihydrouridine synthase B